MVNRHSAGALYLLILGAALAGCGGSDPPRRAGSGGWSAPPPDDGSSPTIDDEDPPPMVTATAKPTDAPPFDGTAGITEKKRPDAPQARLKDVRTGEHEGYDRVVFEFEGSALPGYHVEYVDKPVRQCGSGNPVVVAGDAWLLVRFDPAIAHTDKGKPTVKDRERRLKMPVARELELTCDFEGHVDWVVGVVFPGRYRVLELSGPARVVVDVQHGDGK